MIYQAPGRGGVELAHLDKLLRATTAADGSLREKLKQQISHMGSLVEVDSRWVYRNILVVGVTN